LKNSLYMTAVIVLVQTMFWIGSVQALPITVFTADFESGVPTEFSAGTTSSVGIGAEAINQGLSTYLGRFTLSDSTTLSLTGLPVHTMLELELDAYLFKTWDGNAGGVGPDFFSLSGDVTFSETFTNHRGEGQSYSTGPDVFLNAAGTALSGFGDSNSTMVFFGLGATSTGSSFIIPHTGSTFTVTFGGPTSQTDEQWGIDNVLVTIDGDIPPVGNNGVPEPITATLGLMGLGVLGMATRRRSV